MVVIEISDQQREILRELCADGATNEDIADRLEISVATVKTQMHRLMRKAGVTNRTALAVRLIRGMVRPS